MKRWITAFFIGLIVGVAVYAVGVRVWRMTHAGPWIAAGGDWYRLPAQENVGQPPLTFTTPAKAWDYGASTRALPAPVTAAPAIIRVDVAELSGPVGLSLAKPDGSALISRERKLPEGPAASSVFFRSPGGQPVAVLVRNYDGEGKAGRVTVRSVLYAPEAKISARQLSKINKAGVY